MPKPRRSDGQFSLSYKTLGGIVSLMAVIGVLYGAISRVATKDDVKELATTYGASYQAIENRVRNLEIQFASFFGKSNTNPTAFHPASTMSDENVAFTVIQYGNQMPQYDQPVQNAQKVYQAPVRRVVVTESFIKSHELQPTKGGAYGLLGEDGQFYSIDDVIAILVREHNDYPRMKK